MQRDNVIHTTAWWGERVMAFVIVVTIGSVIATTNIPELVGHSDLYMSVLYAFATFYSLVLLSIVIFPTRITHSIGLVLGVLVFGERAFDFVNLWLLEGRGGWGNVAERVMLTASVVVYHTWGIWTDRRIVKSELL